VTGTVAVILAGGQARRLGGIDKTLIPIGGTPILSIILERLCPQVERIALGANGDPARFGSFALPVLADERQGIGPLGGLLRGLDWAAGLGAESLLTVPGDTPFVPRDLVQALGVAPAVAVSAGRRHHLVALWPVAWRSALVEYLDELAPDAPQRAYGVMAFSRSRGLREVPFETAAGDPFFNVNTPEDRAQAEAHGSAQTGC
jgi:molybdopterin-guanine dinucleotide biosynthesis protein A